MYPRQSIIDNFSTFIGFNEDRFKRWITEPKLRRNMQNHLSKESKTGESFDSESFWALYWHRSWQNQLTHLAQAHLAAYLQEPCYWVAHRTTTQVTGVQYGLSDCFQIAITALPSILKGYSSEQGASLKTYATLCFGNTLRDTLRQQGEADSRTDWGLLRKVSQKRFSEALQASGLAEATISAYSLAWLGFKTLWAGGDTVSTRRLSRPDTATWETIAQFYNTQRAQLPTPTPEATPAILEKWLIFAARQVRQYLHPSLTSLNVQKFEDGAGELQDDLPGVEEEPLAALIHQDEIQERQSQRTQIGEVLTAAITALNSQTQQLLRLYYVEELTQQQIAAQLETKQYTVSRRLNSAKEALLLALAKWSQEKLHISLTSPALKQMNIVLEEWLQNSLKATLKG